MNKNQENIYRLGLKTKGYSEEMIDYYYEYISTLKEKGNASKNMEWIMGFAEFIKKKLTQKE